MAPRREEQARSRKKNISNGSSHSINDLGNGIYVSDTSGHGSSARDDRLARRQMRVKKARARKSKQKGTPLCAVASAVFVVYLVMCVVFFRNMPEAERQVGLSKVRGLVQKTQERVKKTKEQVSSKLRNFGRGESAKNSASAGSVAASQQHFGIPVGKWPVSIRDEDGNFEEIKHPGYEDGSVTMSVPGFWANDPVAIHQNKLMTRERALAIGTCATPDSKGSFTRGDECPVNERTIFVAIASYRDFQCRDTVDSIFSRAAHPERVRVGVVDQIVPGEDGSCDVPHLPCSQDPIQSICLFKNQLDVFQMEAELAVGPVFARHIGHRLYRVNIIACNLTLM
eukprot:CCRYP_010006-RA/>CCRYP_010006-RA protein AED:0.02 eAED:0.02 QI:379/1/1/1/1/1/2/954/339